MTHPLRLSLTPQGAAGADGTMKQELYMDFGSS